MSIGIRELRDTLSRQLARVREGHIITITDHGRPIARIVPVDGPSAYDRLVREGRLRPPSRPHRSAPQPAVGGALVSDLIDEQRG